MTRISVFVFMVFAGAIAIGIHAWLSQPENRNLAETIPAIIFVILGAGIALVLHKFFGGEE